MKIIHPRHLATPIVCLSACFISTAHAQTTTQTAPAQAAIEIPAREVIPVVPLPNPNGYDFYVRAGAALKTENAGPPSVAPKDAATVLALQRAFVAKNAEALRLLREGLRLPSRQPALRAQSYIATGFEPQKQFLQLAKLLVQESRVRLADNDVNGAVDSLLDGVQFGTELVRGGVFMAMLFGNGVEAFPRADLWKLVERLDAANARRAARRLETIEAFRVPLSSVLEEEKWLGLSLLRETMRSPQWAALRAGAHDEAAGQKRSGFIDEGARELAQLQKTSDAQIQANYLAYMDATIANARKPYDIAMPAPPAAADAMSRAYTGETVANLFSRVQYERSAAANRLLLVALALRAYQLEHDAFPATLNDLAPTYLAKIPIDPFSSSGALLRYRREKDAYVLYSVGPDGIDNGGQPITHGRNIVDEDKGDIVVGANT